MTDRGQDTSENGDRYRRLFDLAPLAYHCVDASGCLIEVNQAWLQMLGYERDEVIGRPILDFISRGFQIQFKSAFQLLRDGVAIRGKVMEMVRANGTQVAVEVDVHADFDERGESGQTYTLIRDVSDQPRDAREQSNLARRHALILNAAPGAIIGLDENGRVTFANPATERITGWGPQDLQGVGLHQHMHRLNQDGSPNPAGECATCLALENRDSTRGETWYQRKDGSFFPVEFHTQPYFVEGSYVGGVISFMDITDRVAAQEELRHREEQFRHLFENAPVSLWLEDFSEIKTFVDSLRQNGVTDLDTHFQDHPEDLFKCMGLVEIRDVNQATLDLHRASSLAELRRNLPSVFTEDAARVFRQEIVALANGETGTEAVTTVKTLDGEIRHVLFKVFRDMARENWDTSYVSFTDLTATRRMEELSTRLATAIEQTGDSVIITDCEGAIEYCNPAFEKVTGFSRDEVIGKNPSILKSGQHDDRFYQNLWKAITAGRMWVGHFINRRKDGELFEEEGSISPVFDADGTIVNFVSVKRDVTHQLELERRLSQSQKMEAVGQLAGGIAHDFNNILHAMLGHLEFAMDSDTDAIGIQRELELMCSGVDRASQLTRQLLAFSRRQVLELSNIDANDLIAQLLKMVRRVIGEDIELDFRPGLIDEEIHVDAGQIEQVLLNLCLNARDAMPNGGTLQIVTDREDVGEEFVRAHTWAKPGPYIRISVSDSGVGIDPQVLPQIFEPFFTTKERGRGTGLGLATVYGTIKQHGGIILVDSKLGKGATFRILLPVAVKKVAAEAPAPAAALPAPGGTETILLAEDDEAVRKVISRVLARVGYRVLEAEDGKEALAVFAEHSAEIDLALLDMVMPVLGGPEVAREIQAQRPAVRILFNTGYSEDAIRGRISPGSQAPLLMKPHDPKVLLTCIRDLLDSPPRGHGH